MISVCAVGGEHPPRPAGMPVLELAVVSHEYGRGREVEKYCGADPAWTRAVSGPSTAQAGPNMC